MFTKNVAYEAGWSWSTDTWTLWLVPRKFPKMLQNFLIFYLP